MVCLTWLSMKGEYYFSIMYSCCSSKTEKKIRRDSRAYPGNELEIWGYFKNTRNIYLFILKIFYHSLSKIIFVKQFIFNYHLSVYYIFSYSCNELRNTHFVALYVGKLLEKIYLFPAYLKKRFLSWRWLVIIIIIISIQFQIKVKMSKYFLYVFIIKYIFIGIDVLS